MEHMNTTQIKLKYDSNTNRIWLRYNFNTTWIWLEYDFNTIQIQLQYNSNTYDFNTILNTTLLLLKYNFSYVQWIPHSLSNEFLKFWRTHFKVMWAQSILRKKLSHLSSKEDHIRLICDSNPAKVQGFFSISFSMAQIFISILVFWDFSGETRKISE